MTGVEDAVEEEKESHLRQAAMSFIDEKVPTHHIGVY